MDQIHIRFDRLCNTNTLFQIISSLKKFRTAHTELDRESGTYSLSYCCEDFLSEAHTVFYRTAVLVSSVVEKW